MYTLLAQALLAQGNCEEAHAAAAGAEELAGATEKLQSKVLAAIAMSHVGICGSQKDAEAAADRAEAARQQAAEAGFYGLALEAELTLGQVERCLGRLEAGRSRLVAVEKDALGRDSDSIARKAAAARGVLATGGEILLA